MATYNWAAEHAPKFVEDEDYEYDHDKRKVELTAEGRQKMRALPAPDLLRGVGLIDLYEYIERAIKVHRDFHLDRQYVVRDGEIVIVDEFTGRLAEGRKWRDGIHQAIEAKERVEVTVPTGQAARITMQDLFLRYQYLAGMTGTALTSAREFRKIYRTRVVPVPTNRPVIRQRLATRVFGTSDQKWAAVVEEVKELHAQGRPVLIGTRSIDKSRNLSRLLDGVRHRALRAQRQRDRQGGRHRGAGRPAGRSDRRDEHGRPRHRHQTGPEGGRAGRAAGHRHRDARRGPHRPPAVRPLRPPGRSGHVPPVPGLGRRDHPQRPGAGLCRQDGEARTAGHGPGRSLRKGLSAMHNARWNASTSATAKCCCTTRRNARRCSGKWGRTRFSTRPSDRFFPEEFRVKSRASITYLSVRGTWQAAARSCAGLACHLRAMDQPSEGTEQQIVQLIRQGEPHGFRSAAAELRRTHRRLSAAAIPVAR